MDRQPERRTVKVGKHQVGLRYWPGEGQPMVLLHGFLDSAEGWDRLCQATTRPCYALDLPGFGRSVMPEEPRLESYAERLSLAVDRLALEQKPLWVGHSMGGAVTRAIADSAHGDDVDSIALITPAGFGHIPLAEWADGPVTRKILTVVFPALSINPLAVFLAYPTQVSGGIPADSDLVLRTMRSALRGPQGPSWAVQALAHMSSLPEYELMRESSFKGPVRSLWGTRDRLIPSEHSKNLHYVYPQCRVTIWPDLAHHPQVEQPLRLKRWLSLSKPAPSLENVQK